MLSAASAFVDNILLLSDLQTIWRDFSSMVVNQSGGRPMIVVTQQIIVVVSSLLWCLTFTVETATFHIVRH